MQSPTIIYSGTPSLQSEVLATYFTNLGVSFRRASTMSELVDLTGRVPLPLVVLADSGSPKELVRTARRLIVDPSSAFPHVFILTDAEPFDAQVESITVISGPAKLRHLAEHLRVLIRGLQV